MPIQELTPGDLRLSIDASSLGFADTSELLHLPLPWIGQARAEEAAGVVIAVLVGRQLAHLRLNDVAINDGGHLVTLADLNADGVLKLAAGKKKIVLIKPL